MADFTATQGRYLAYISAYTNLHGCPPAESEISAAICVSAPSVNQMVKTLEKKGLIQREPGKPRSIRVLVPEHEIPPWKGSKKATSPDIGPHSTTPVPAFPPANLYAFSVFLAAGPTTKKFTNKEISRTIEIRGDQTLEKLHDAIFKAYDRWDEHLYEFQFGKGPHDPAGPNYGVPNSHESESRDARSTKIDDLQLKPNQAFGYWFDFGDDWYHQICVERMEKAIPTVTYPRITKRVGKSPPQYPDE